MAYQNQKPVVFVSFRSLNLIQINKKVDNYIIVTITDVLHQALRSFFVCLFQNFITKEVTLQFGGLKFNKHNRFHNKEN